MEAYSLFGQSGAQQPVNILSNFSNVNISPPKRNVSVESGDGRATGDVINGEWPSNHSDGNGFGGNQDSFECYEQNSKDTEEFDRSDDILNLESISGNTLAEKIANAENDIRNENEILMRGMKEQVFRILNNVDTEETATSVDQEQEVQNSPPVCNVERCEDADDLNEEIGPEQGCCLAVKTKQADGCDCLTENSDFVTAENSISDAESSTEFGDAENSLELEDDMDGDKTELDNDVPSAQPIADDEDRDQTLNCSNSPQNVPILNETSECNNIDNVDDSMAKDDHDAQTNDTSMLKDNSCNKDFTTVDDTVHTPLPNGDLADSDKVSASCGGCLFFL